MPTAVTTGAPAGTTGGTAQNQRGGQATAPAAIVPFIRASQEHREPAGFDVSRLMTTADIDLGVAQIPAYGYLRSILVLVEATGGVGTAVALTEDSPWNAIKNIALQEPNGAAIAQFNTGWDLYLANKYGGLRRNGDPRASVIYSAGSATTGNFKFLLRVPVELNLREGLGSLPNQNSGAQFQIRLQLARASDIYSVVPTTLPTVRVRLYVEAWDQPDTISPAGTAQQTTPPAMNTTQYWSSQTFTVNAGANTIRLTRMGNYLRNLLLVHRTTSRALGEANWPDVVTLYWDTRPLDIVQADVWRHTVSERYGYGQVFGVTAPAVETANGRDNGVFPYDFCHEFDGQVGLETRDLWVPTLGSTRMEIGGTFPAAGTLTVLTNDVAVAGNVFL